MNNPVRYRGVVIEDIPGAPWTIAYGWRGGSARYFAVIRACPDYTSDEARLASWDALVADIFGECDLCGAVASTPAELKTAPSDGRAFVGSFPVPHRDECPCAVERLEALDRRDSPDGMGTPADCSEQSRSALAEFLNAAMAVMW